MFFKGIRSVIPQDLLYPFDASELAILMSGSKQIDVDDWWTNTFYKGEYAEKKEKHKVVQWFWEELKSLD